MKTIKDIFKCTGVFLCTFLFFIGCVITPVLAVSTTDSSDTDDSIDFLSDDDVADYVDLDDWSCGSRSVFAVLNEYDEKYFAILPNMPSKMKNFREMRDFLRQQNIIAEAVTIPDLKDLPLESIVQLKQDDDTYHFMVYKGLEPSTTNANMKNVILMDGSLPQTYEYSIEQFNQEYTHNTITTTPNNNKNLIPEENLTKITGTRQTKYKDPRTSYDPNSPLIQKAIQEANIQECKTPQEKAQNLYKWIKKHVCYHYHQNTKRNMSYLLISGKGNCCEQARLMHALCTAAGIKNKFVRGKCNFRNYGNGVGHAWTRCYVYDNPDEYLTTDTTNWKGIGYLNPCSIDYVGNSLSW